MIFFGKGIQLKKKKLKTLRNSSTSLDFKKDSLKHEAFQEVFKQPELGQKCTRMPHQQPELSKFNSTGQSDAAFPPCLKNHIFLSLPTQITRSYKTSLVKSISRLAV